MFASGELQWLLIAASIGVAFTIIVALSCCCGDSAPVGTRICRCRQRRTLATNGSRDVDDPGSALGWVVELVHLLLLPPRARAAPSRGGVSHHHCEWGYNQSCGDRHRHNSPDGTVISGDGDLSLRSTARAAATRRRHRQLGDVEAARARRRLLGAPPPRTTHEETVCVLQEPARDERGGGGEPEWVGLLFISLPVTHDGRRDRHDEKRSIRGFLSTASFFVTTSPYSPMERGGSVPAAMGMPVVDQQLGQTCWVMHAGL